MARSSPTPASSRLARDALAIGLAVGVFGVTFGVLAVATGLTVAQACAMSLLVFTGGSQFAAVGVIDAGGSPASAVGSALLLAARNGMYGVALSRTIRVRGVRRLVASHLVIDESTAMATAQADPETAERAFWLTGTSVFVCWNLGTLLGALGGDAIGDPATFGLDAAFPAGFLALMAPSLRRRDGRAAAVAGGLIALVTIPLVPAGVPILLAAFGVVPGFLVGRRNEEPA
jgi:4-azaleucine resistance transporter AzlC